MKNEEKVQFKDMRMLMEKQYDKLTDEINDRQQVKELRADTREQLKELREGTQEQLKGLREDTQEQLKGLQANTEKQYGRVTADLKAIQEQVKGLGVKLTEVQVTQVRPLVNFTLHCPSVQPEFASGS